MTTTTPIATYLETDLEVVSDDGLFSGSPVADEHGIRRFGNLPAVVHYMAVDKLGKKEKRSKFWVEDHRRALTLAAASAEFRAVCRANEVSPGTVMQYVFACLQDSDQFGKDISTGVKKLAKRMGKSSRQMHRARRVARKTGFERFAKRSWQEPNEGNTWKRTSTLVRPMIPKRLAQQVEQQRLNAAKRIRSARRKQKSRHPGVSTSKPAPTKPDCQRCGGIGTVPVEQPDGTILAMMCAPCSPP